MPLGETCDDAERCKRRRVRFDAPRGIITRRHYTSQHGVWTGERSDAMNKLTYERVDVRHEQSVRVGCGMALGNPFVSDDHLELHDTPRDVTLAFQEWMVTGVDTIRVATKRELCTAPWPIPGKTTRRTD